jgi:hypothetical protein
MEFLYSPSGGSWEWSPIALVTVAHVVSGGRAQSIIESGMFLHTPNNFQWKGWNERARSENVCDRGTSPQNARTLLAPKVMFAATSFLPTEIRWNSPLQNSAPYPSPHVP